MRRPPPFFTLAPSGRFGVAGTGGQLFRWVAAGDRSGVLEELGPGVEAAVNDAGSVVAGKDGVLHVWIPGEEERVHEAVTPAYPAVGEQSVVLLSRDEDGHMMEVFDLPRLAPRGDPVHLALEEIGGCLVHDPLALVWGLTAEGLGVELHDFSAAQVLWRGEAAPPDWEGWCFGPDRHPMCWTEAGFTVIDPARRRVVSQHAWPGIELAAASADGALVGWARFDADDDTTESLLVTRGNVHSAACSEPVRVPAVDGEVSLAIDPEGVISLAIVKRPGLVRLARIGMNNALTEQEFELTRS